MLCLCGVHLIARVQRLQNLAIQVTKSLHKFDYVTSHRRELSWLPVSHIIQLQSIAAMSYYYHQEALFLDPL